MSKKLKKFLSCVIGFAMLFTSVFANCSFTFAAGTLEEVTSLDEYIAYWKENPVAPSEDENGIKYGFGTNDCGDTNGLQGNEGLVGTTGLYKIAGGKLTNYGNMADNAQCNVGTVLYVPVNGVSDIYFKTNNKGTPTITVEDDAAAVPEGTTLFKKTETFASDANENTIKYEGKSQSVVKITLDVAYINYIRVVSSGKPAEEVKVTWLPKNFALDINGTKVKVTGAEGEKTNSAIAFEGENASKAIVLESKATTGHIKVALGETSLTQDMISVAEGEIETSLAGNVITITYKNAEIAPFTYALTVEDADVVVKPEAGKTYSYDFTTGEIISSIDGTVSNKLTKDGLMVIDNLKYNNDHGLGLLNGGSFKIKVAGNADIDFVCCQYGSSAPITASVLNGAEGVITPESDNLKVDADKTVKRFSYTGEEAEILFKLAESGIDGYLHGITVINAEKQQDEAKPEAGKTYTYDFKPGTIVSAGDGTVSNKTTEDGLMIMNGISYHGSDHGLVLPTGASFKIKVAGDADVTFVGCQFGTPEAEGSQNVLPVVMKASVSNGAQGTVTPESQDVHTATDGGSVVFNYKGEEAELLFKVDETSAGGYLHGITVKNAAKVSGDLTLEDADTLPKFIEYWKQNPVAVNDTGERYSFDDADIGKVNIGENKEGRAGKTYVDTSENGKLNNDRGDNLAQCNNNTKIYVPVNGAADIYINHYNANPKFTVEDIADGVPAETKLYTNTEIYTDGKGKVEHMIKYEGKSQSVVKITLNDVGYISYIRVVSKGVQAGEVPDTWIPKNFALNINGTKVKVTGAANVAANSTITFEGDSADKAVVNESKAEKGDVKVSLGGKKLTQDLITVAEGDVTAALTEDGVIKVTYTDAAIRPFEYLLTVSDSDVIVKAEAGKVYSYNFAPGDIISSGDGTVKNKVTKDGIMTIDNVSWHDTTHGLTLSNGGSFTIKVAGDADIQFICCMYGYTAPITASVLNGAQGMVSPANGDLKADSDGGVKTFRYFGEEAEIQFKLADSGVNAYLHGINVKNYKPAEEEGNVNISGSFITSDDGNVTVPDIKFIRLSDLCYFKGTLNADGKGYTAKVAEGDYEIISPNNEGYEALNHVVVKGTAAVTKDIKFINTAVPETAYKAKVTVGGTGADYADLKTALKAINAMGDTDKTVTVNIAPGTYRAQHILTRPNVKLVNTDPTREVKLTWYYGVGYKYYSADNGGFYNELNDSDKYLKNGGTNGANGKSDPTNTGTIGNWGGAFYIQSSAKNFYAENITFENSFNKYVTEEELADGVEPVSLDSDDTKIDFDRTAANVDVKKKAATERAAAILAYGDNAEFYNCKISSSQDTLYTQNGTHQYYKNCFIEGMTDYIFGGGSLVFDDCTLNFCGYSDSSDGGHITAASEGSGKLGGGYLFTDCKITGDTGTGSLGRPWKEGCTVRFINPVIAGENVVQSKGFSDWGGGLPVKHEKVFCYVYNAKTADGTAVTYPNVSAAMTAEDAAAIDPAAWFGAWEPVHYGEINEEYDPTVMYGDLNEDGVISSEDVAIALAYVLAPDNMELSEKALKAASVDGAAGVTMNDVALILDKALSDGFVFPIKRGQTAAK